MSVPALTPAVPAFVERRALDRTAPASAATVTSDDGVEYWVRAGRTMTPVRNRREQIERIALHNVLNDQLTIAAAAKSLRKDRQS